MATTKSTVVGIRLDHDRRAWVEAEAARLGVSTRGLFEGMIDEARSGEKADATRATAGLGSPALGSVDAIRVDANATTPGADGDAGANGAEGVNSPVSTSTTSPSWTDFGTVTAVPGGLIREAVSLTASLVELGGRFAAKGLGVCVLTRHCRNRSM
jgi:hypothetical protein